MEFNNKQKAVLYTICYSDIFNFPLTEKELWRDLIFDKKIDKTEVKKIAESLSEIIIRNDGYYCLKGREQIIEERKKRNAIALHKVEIAKRVVKFLMYIPTIYFIGLTGKVSHMDADVHDDIDLFFIVKKNTVWSTRLLILATLEILNIRRRHADPHPENKICPNLIIDQTALAWSSRKQDLYTAHEITHIYPLLDRKNMRQKFLNSNKWVCNFYPNASLSEEESVFEEKQKSYVVIKIICAIASSRVCEYISKIFQRIYMSKKVHNETILSNILAFHPRDYRIETLNNLASKLKQYRLLTNQ